MRALYIPQLRKYILAGALLAFILGFICRIAVPTVSISEISLHSALRQSLGYPASYYAHTTLISLSILYQIFYAFFGAMLGVLYFKIINKRQGYTILFSSNFLRALGLMLFCLLFFYLRVDALNSYQNTIRLPSIRLTVIQPIFTTIKKMFLPNIAIQVNSPTTQPSHTNQPTTTTVSRTNTVPKAQSQPQTQLQPTSAPQKTLTSQALLAALNAYRQRNGVHTLTWDTRLAGFSNERAAYFTQLGNIDGQGGFMTLLSQKGGANGLGFYSMAENSAYSVTHMTAEEIINDLFGTISSTSRSHPLNPKWYFVGISVNGRAVNITYGGEKCPDSSCPH